MAGNHSNLAYLTVGLCRIRSTCARTCQLLRDRSRRLCTATYQTESKSQLCPVLSFISPRLRPRLGRRSNCTAFRYTWPLHFACSAGQRASTIWLPEPLRSGGLADLLASVRCLTTKAVAPMPSPHLAAGAVAPTPLRQGLAAKAAGHDPFNEPSCSAHPSATWALGTGRLRRLICVFTDFAC
jgi:hypothetical protein